MKLNIYKFAAIIFGIGSVIALTITILLFLNTFKIVKNSENVNATVIEYVVENGDYYPVVEIENSKEKVQLQIGSSKPQYTVGEQISLLYYADDPQLSLINNFKNIWFAPMISLIITLGMLFFSIGFASNTFFMEIKGKRLVQTGTKVQAIIVEIEHNKLYPQDFGMSVPYIIRAEWKNPEDGQTYKFRSKYLQNTFDLKTGDTIDVYINKDNPEKYFMDVKA